MTQTTDAALVERLARFLASQHYAERFKKAPGDPHVIANVEGNWQIFKPSALAVSFEVQRVTAEAAGTIEAQARRIEALEGAVVTIMGRCESLEDEAADGLSKEMGDHAYGWYRGQKYTAKSLRRHLHDLTRSTP